MSELFAHFGINWKLLAAQTVNFFILIFILRKFAYRPILDMLKKRKGEIEKGLEYTRKAGEELKRIDAVRDSTLQKAHQDALGIVTEAEEAGKKHKDEILAEAQKKVEGVVMDARKLIEEEKAKMGEAVYKEAEELVRSGVAKVLGKMPPEEKNKPLVAQALQELKAAQKGS